MARTKTSACLSTKQTKCLLTEMVAITALLKLPTMLLVPGAMAMEALLKDPIATADEINTLQLDNIADGIDSVSAHYGWRPTRPSTWAQENWKKTRAR